MLPAQMGLLLPSISDPDICNKFAYSGKTTQTKLFWVNVAGVILQREVKKNEDTFE